ncbi:MAG: T9SS type A sorting domain-containing protein, partial [Flavobacteriaceae bacterium]
CVPACDAPTALTATATSVSATLGWTSDGNNFDIEWGTQGFTPGSGTLVTDIATNSYNLTDLDYETQYEFYVRQDCSVNESDWAGPFGFTTLPQCPTGYLSFYSQAEVNAFATNYPNCTEISGDLYISGSTITDLSPLSNLTSIGGYLWIYNNSNLTNLDGLSNLTSVGADLVILFNSSLTDISGLQNIDPASILSTNGLGLYIVGNTSLSVCNLENFCTYLAGSGPRTISDNAGDCISEAAIMDACDLSGNCDTYTIWDGLTWSNGTPDANKRMIIEGNLTLTEDLTACEILLNSGIITINPDVTLTVNGQIINTQTAEAFTVKSDGVLIQVDEVENTGAITVWRNSSPMKRLDYTLWSSPVSGMLLKNFSEVSPSGGYGTLWNRVYTLGETAWEQVWADQEIYLTDNSMTFTEGTGYLYRSRNDYDAVNTVVFEGEFTGVPQNGTITIDAPYLFNAVGNPYPSPIDADEILAGGASALYFWTNSNAPNQSGTYVSNNWATYSGAGGAIASNGNQTPDGIIQTAQGFVVGFETANPSRQVTFNNTMRLAEHYGQFFKQMSNEKHRLWLNLSDEAVTYNQILVGYIENATQGFDTGIDAKMFAYEGNAIYSLIENSEEKFVIQGRELPFTDADVVPIGFRAVNAGSFTISLNNFDGLFEEGNTQIYLKDNFNQTQHNLNDGAYTFVSEEGIFDNRFEIVYQTTMSVENPDVSNADWIVYRKKDGFQIQTNGFDMKEVSVYDLLGRKIYASQAEGVTHHIPNIGTEGVYIVKVITTEHQILSKKVR